MASPAFLSHGCGNDIVERPEKVVPPRTLVAAVEDKIADSCAESRLSSSAASSPAAWDLKEPSTTAQRHGGLLPTQNPENSSVTKIATKQRQGGTKRLHAALSPVDEDNANADIRAKRRKLILTLRDAEVDGLTNWYSHVILYGERIEHPAALREILDEAVERGISHLSPAKVKSITIVQDDELTPPPAARRPSFRDRSTALRMASPPALPKTAADRIHSSPPGPSKPREALAPDPDHTPSDIDNHVPAPPPSCHPSGWTPINHEGAEEDTGGVDGGHGAGSPALASDDNCNGDNESPIATALPEVGDCFRGQRYGGGHPGVTWAALVEPLVVEDCVANMQAGKKVMALQRAREKEAAAAATTTMTKAATEATKRKRRPQTPAPETRKNKRQERKEGGGRDGSVAGKRRAGSGRAHEPRGEPVHFRYLHQ